VNRPRFCAAIIHRRGKAILSAFILFTHQITRTTRTTLDQTGKDITILFYRVQSTHISFIPVDIHNFIDFFPYFRINERIKDTFKVHNFVNRLFSAARAFTVIITIVAFIHRITQKIADGFRSPFAAALGRYAVGVVIIADLSGRLNFQIHFIHCPTERGFLFGMYRPHGGRIPVPPIRYTRAVPFPFVGASDHNVFHTFTCQFSFQFRKYKNNLQDSFADRGRRVKLFVQ